MTYSYDEVQTHKLSDLSLPHAGIRGMCARSSSDFRVFFPPTGNSFRNVYEAIKFERTVNYDVFSKSLTHQLGQTVWVWDLEYLMTQASYKILKLFSIHHAFGEQNFLIHDPNFYATISLRHWKWRQSAFLIIQFFIFLIFSFSWQN